MTTQMLTRPTQSSDASLAVEGWHDDPRNEHKLRFHDGLRWTEHTTHHGPVPCVGCHR